MANGHGFAIPCVVWLNDIERQQLADIAELSGACTERVGARLLGRALLLYAASEPIEPPKPETSTTRAGKPGKQNIAPRSREL